MRSTVSRLLADASFFLAIVSALLYITGWAYLGGYYELFNLDLDTLDLPSYTVFLNSLIPLIKLDVKLIPALRVCILVVIAATWLDQHAWPPFRAVVSTISRLQGWLPSKPIMRIGFYGLLLFQLLIGWITFAIKAGETKAKRYYEHPSPLHVTFKKDESQLFAPELWSANANGTLMVLAQTKDLVVMFVKAKGSKIGDRVFIVPRSNLLTVQNGPALKAAASPENR